MTLPALTSPFIPLMDLAANGLNGGQVYIGIADEDPVANPQAVYWDAAGTIPASQPLAVEGGYIMRLGTPAVAYTVAPYSMKVEDRSSSTVFSQAYVPGYATTVDIAGLAPLDSPEFTGTPTTPTAPLGTADTGIANTVFVQAAIDDIPAASTSERGEVLLATIADVIAGTNATSAVTPESLGTALKNFSSNGHKTDPNGFTVNWGIAVSSGTAIGNCVASLDEPFNSVCFGAWAVIQGGTTGSYTIQLTDHSSLTDVTFSVLLDGAFTSGAGIFYVAIGY